MITKWNTGAHYTRHGQRIIAEQAEDGSIRFFDRDRMISGKIKAPSRLMFRCTTEDQLRRKVMREYLDNNYEMDIDTRWATPHLED